MWKTNVILEIEITYKIFGDWYPYYRYNWSEYMEIQDNSLLEEDIDTKGTS